MNNYIVIFFLSLIFLISCSSGSKLKQATFEVASKHGMKYHYVLSIPQSLMAHDPVSIIKNEKIIIKEDVYTNRLGEVPGNQVIMSSRRVNKNVIFIFTTKKVVIKKFQACDDDGVCTRMPDVNGVYPVK